MKDIIILVRECLSTHINPSVQNRTYVSLNPINIKPFYIQPHMTHEKEINFAQKELEKYRLMGILRKGSSEFLSPVMLIEKSHDGTQLNTKQEYRMVVDFKHLNSHLPDIKFSYPEVKHILNKIGRSKSCVYSVLDLKHAFYCINLDEESNQYTSCCALLGSPVYQFRKLAQRLKSSPAFFTSLMNGILSELTDDIRERVECIMGDVVVYTSDIDMHMKVIKAFMYKLKDHGLLLTINKVHTFRKEVKYMGLRMSSSEGGPTITPLGSRVKAIATLPIPITVRGIKSFIGCILYLAQFLPHLSKLVKPINDILKKSNKLQ